MTTIADLEFRIRSAQTVIKNAEGTLERLNAELTELKKQEKGKQSEPESLFGRWATHPEYGRGIIISDKPDFGGEVKFAYHWNPEDEDPTTCHYVNLGGLALDPVTLTTTEEYQAAPVGTIIEVCETAVARKISKQWWDRSGTQAPWSNVELSDEIGTCRVIRWGNGR